ncbi:hypothetical protein [Halobacillus litoralis]|uniref:hypothetical protein n=1 Tax=Halobacillus litoralis TaxID=45668 RepID=UPI001CD5F632|nr:hypothetical protein [Halobacillus litoralis]MCA1020562.1 hypothetical protein [Halobacillus litoralis]
MIENLYQVDEEIGNFHVFHVDAALSIGALHKRVVEVTDRIRSVFAKYKDNLGFHRYRFVGVYQLAGISPDDNRFMRYERVSDRVEIGRG